MPSFYVPDLDVDIEEFMNACSKKEINEIIDFLNEIDQIPRNEIDQIPRNEIDQTFVYGLRNLENKWNVLSIEDEETILRISQKY